MQTGLMPSSSHGTCSAHALHIRRWYMLPRKAPATPAPVLATSPPAWPSQALPPSPFPALLPDPLGLHPARTFPPFVPCKMLALEHRSWNGSVVLHSLTFPWKTTKEPDPNGEHPQYNTQNIPPALQLPATLFNSQQVMSCYPLRLQTTYPVKTFLPARCSLSGTSPIPDTYFAFK